MLKLETSPREPVWLDLLPGVRVRVRPVTVADMLLARAAAAEALGPAREKDDGAAASDAVPDRAVTVAAASAFTRSLALSGILAWEGVGDAMGRPVEPTPDRIAELLEVWPAYEAIDRLYVGPALARLDEKNV